MSKKRYAQVGLGGRGAEFTKNIVEQFSHCCELVAVCDSNPGRVEFTVDKLAKLGATVKMYPAEKFEEMITENNIERVMVTTGPDATHDDYIIRAMKLGCDVMTEKPMTIDETRCRAILNTVEETGQDLQVTFNYRYAPPRSQVRRLLADGVIGDILSVDFTWLLNTTHGADYFRRWHRHRENSGSLLVHKSTHHFDLVNWWLQDVPETVFCAGSRNYYTPAQGDLRGLKNRGERCLTCEEKGNCPFYFDPERGNLRALYFDPEKYDGYFRDRCVFAEGIDIWDTMAATVTYQRGTILNYMLHAHSPYEGYQIAFNGTKGRLEHSCCESTYVNGDGTVPGQLDEKKTTITLIPEFSEAEELEVDSGEGGHGGGDPLLLKDIFETDLPNDPLARRAGQRDGAYSILVGVAAAKSIDTNQPVNISDLLGDAPLGD